MILHVISYLFVIRLYPKFPITFGRSIP
jgi:hypothetical protein